MKTVSTAMAAHLAGETTTLAAATESELNQLVDDHLDQHYPTPQAEGPEPAGMG